MERNRLNKRQKGNERYVLLFMSISDLQNFMGLPAAKETRFNSAYDSRFIKTLTVHQNLTVIALGLKCPLPYRAIYPMDQQARLKGSHCCHHYSVTCLRRA